MGKMYQDGYIQHPGCTVVIETLRDKGADFFVPPVSNKADRQSYHCRIFGSFIYIDISGGTFGCL